MYQFFKKYSLILILLFNYAYSENQNQIQLFIFNDISYLSLEEFCILSKNLYENK